MLTGLVNISSNVVQEGHVKAPVILSNNKPWRNARNCSINQNLLRIDNEQALWKLRF